MALCHHHHHHGDTDDKKKPDEEDKDPLEYEHEKTKRTAN
jgi:hypothetical protein